MVASADKGFFTFSAILEESRRRGFGSRAFEIARTVYQKRTGEPCPFLETAAPTPAVVVVKAPPALGTPRAAPVAVVDFETRSRCDLRAHGASVYAEDPSTEILCLAWSIDDGPVGLWIPTDGGFPSALAAHLGAGGLLEAHNAEFEQAIWHYVGVARLGWPEAPDTVWRDSMARVAAMALPLSLGGAAAAIGQAQQKDEEGRRIMLRLCKPRRPSKNDPREWFDDAEDFAALYRYCKLDVTAEAGLGKSIPDISPAEALVWAAHNRMNRRGIHVDRPGINAALRMLALTETMIGERVRAATAGSLTIDDLGRREHVLEWCRSRGVPLEAFRKADVSAALDGETPLPAEVRAVLEARRSLGRTSTAKFQAMLDRANTDDRVRGTLVYHGATTGRWTGRGVQPQNLPREAVEDVDATLADMAALSAEAFAEKHGDPFQAAVGCLRGCLTAAPGLSLVAADYAQIETRVLFWLAEDAGGLQIFRDYDAKRGPDIYRVMAATIFGCPAADVSKIQRQLGKAAILGLGFGMGGAKFYTTCATAGSPVEADLAERTVKIYRGKFSAVKSFWFQTEDAAVQAVNAAGTATFESGRIRFRMIGPHLFCKLPSGRRLCYPFAELGERQTPWGEWRQAVTFRAENALSRKWEPSDTYGGKLVENIVQGAARDLLAGALVSLDAQPDWRPVFMCHDEIVCEVPGDPSEAKARELEAAICDLPAWAAGLPVAAEGFSSHRYRK